MFPVFVALLIALCSSREQVIEAQQQSGGCSVCQLVVSYVEGYLESNQTEQQIEAQLDQLCSNLPVFGRQCVNIVNSQLPNLIAWIKNNEDPQKFCASVGICSSSVVPKEDNSIPCSLCEIVGEFVEHWVALNSSEEMIIAQLDAFCNFTGPLSSKCDSFVAIYVPRLIKWVEANEPPAVFCAQVDLCSPSDVVVVPRVTKEKPFFQYRGKISRGIPARPHNHQEHAEVASEASSTMECQICDVVVTYIEAQVAQQQNVERIVAGVEEICTLLPASLKATCNTFAARYVPQCVAWILRQEDPQTFCSQVDLC